MRRLVFDGQRQVRCERAPVPAVTPGCVRVRALYSQMSTGTENIVFNRQFEPGTHWDNWVQYPFYPGYTAVAEIDDVADDVKRWHPGDRVILRMPHASHAVTASESCFPVPDDVDLKIAPWAKLAQIAYAGAVAATYSLGDSVAVVGAGPIGQMAVRWATAAGCETVIAIDPVELRLRLASHGGATHVAATELGNSRSLLLDANNGRLPRVVMDTTGVASVLPLALASTADFGLVILLGDTGSPSGQHLTSDVLTRGLTIRGVHHTHQVPAQEATYRLFFKLVSAGRFDMYGINTHVFTPEECAKAYDVANTHRGETMGILFDWGGGIEPC